METYNLELNNRIITWKFPFGQGFQTRVRQGLGKSLVKGWARVWARVKAWFKQGFGQDLGKGLGNGSGRVWARIQSGILPRLWFGSGGFREGHKIAQTDISNFWHHYGHFVMPYPHICIMNKCLCCREDSKL